MLFKLVSFHNKVQCDCKILEGRHYLFSHFISNKTETWRAKASDG